MNEMEIEVEARINDDETLHLIEQIPANVQELLQQSEVRRQLKSQPVYLKYFWKILLIVSAFYILPSIQFVFFQYTDPQVTCYFNFKCAKTYFGLTAFNNVISNLAYIIAGSAFLVILHVTKPVEDGINGLHTDMSLYYCMGVTILCEGFFSALYHVCPSRINFQFDTTYMLIGSGLLFFTLHQKRHATLTAGAFKSFAFFALFIFINFLSLTNINVYLFWILFIMVFAYISISGTCYLLAHKRLSLNPSFSILWGHIKKFFKPREIEDKFRFYCLFIANLLNWAIVLASAIIGIIDKVSNNFSNLILGVMILNFLIYLFYYIGMKIKYRERIHLMVWVLFVVMILSWGLGFYFFEIAVTNKFLPIDESNKLNQPCILFGFFDSHDTWHFFSAIGLFTIMSIVYFVDWDLRYVPRSLIKVF